MHADDELALKQAADGVSFEVRVVPRASRTAIKGVAAGALKVSLTAPPVDGAANAALCEFVAEVLEVPRRAVEITHGEHAKRKTVRVLGIDAATVSAKIGAALGPAGR